MAITLGLITFIGAWNEYIWTLLISSSDPSLQTLPVLVVFLVFQKYYLAWRRTQWPEVSRPL